MKNGCGAVASASDTTGTCTEHATLEVADSKFLSFVRPTATQEDAKSFQSELKQHYPDAAHVPVAWVASLEAGGHDGDKIRWSDEDDEPPGAAIGSILSSEIEHAAPLTEGLAVAVVRYFGTRLLGVTCGRLSQCYEAVAELGLHRYFHPKEAIQREILDVDKSVYGLAAGDTEVILNVVSDPNNEIIDKIVSEVEFEGFRGSKDEELPRKQNLQADGVADGLIPVYRYPGNYRGDEWETFEWSPTTKKIKVAVEEALLPLIDQHMNHSVANLYRKGDDFIDHHSDKDLDLDRTGVIVSVSLGEERVLELRRRAEPRDTTRIVLPHGSMLVLGPRTNKFFTHGILKRMDSNGPRLSLTLRNVKTFLDTKTGRLFGQGVSAESLDEIRRNTLIENSMLVAGSAAGAAFALSPRFASTRMKAKEVVLFGVAYAATLFSLRLVTRVLVKRKEEREARAFFSKASVSGTKY